jgi:hypothetical protein
MRNGYLIGAIDHAAPADQNWKKVLDEAIKSTELIDQQVTLFDPAGPWLLNGDFIHGAERRYFIEKVNRAAMDASDFAIANLPKSIFSIGSIVEINDYFESNKPIILATDIPFGANVYLSNRVSPDLYVEYQTGAPALEVAAGLLERLVSLLHDFGGENSNDQQKEASHTYRYTLRNQIENKKSRGVEKMCTGNAGIPSASVQRVRY